jgi:hypothetical protein
MAEENKGQENYDNYLSIEVLIERIPDIDNRVRIRNLVKGINNGTLTNIDEIIRQVYNDNEKYILQRVFNERQQRIDEENRRIQENLVDLNLLNKLIPEIGAVEPENKFLTNIYNKLIILRDYIYNLPSFKYLINELSELGFLYNDILQYSYNRSLNIVTERPEQKEILQKYIEDTVYQAIHGIAVNYENLGGLINNNNGIKILLIELLKLELQRLNKPQSEIDEKLNPIINNEEGINNLIIMLIDIICNPRGIDYTDFSLKTRDNVINYIIEKCIGPRPGFDDVDNLLASQESLGSEKSIERFAEPIIPGRISGFTPEEFERFHPRLMKIVQLTDKIQREDNKNYRILVEQGQMLRAAESLVKLGSRRRTIVRRSTGPTSTGPTSYGPIRNLTQNRQERLSYVGSPTGGKKTKKYKKKYNKKSIKKSFRKQKKTYKRIKKMKKTKKY